MWIKCKINGLECVGILLNKNKISLVDVDGDNFVTSIENVTDLRRLKFKSFNNHKKTTQLKNNLHEN